jgi:hypothetical protein
MSSKRLKPDEKLALIDWESFVKSVEQSTTADYTLSVAEKEKLRLKLEEDPEKWIFEMFPNYAKAPFAPFHKRMIRRIINNFDWYEVLSWSRELSKTTTVMMAVLYLVLTGKKKNTLMVSDSKDNAIRLLNPYRANLEGNQRIKYFYGNQVGFKWKDDEFYTKKGAAFRALGAQMSPRGSKNEAIRPDVILVDDYDTDEECLNPDIITKKWKWFEEALYFTRSISEPLLTIWCGNIIAEDCCITRAGERARELSKLPKKLGNWDIINLRMVDIKHPDPVNDFKYGKSVWPEKNSEEQIDLVQAQVSEAAVQKECYNNPYTEGKVFPEMKFGKVPPLQSFPFLVAYGDPAPSNSQNPKGSYKTLWLVGMKEGVYYVITGYLDKVVNATFVEWYYAIRDYIKDRSQAYNYIENNKLQDPFYQQVFIPLFFDAAKDHKGIIVGITPDTRVKPDKFSRIEGNLEPINRFNRLVLNEAEKDNPHMKRLVKQFKAITPKLPAPADGPDCIEGAKWIIDEKLSAMKPDSYKSFQKSKNNKRI